MANTIQIGETSTGIILNDGEQLYVLGTARLTTVNSGGTMEVQPKGYANSTTVNSGGELIIRDGGIAYKTEIKSGGVMNAWDGSTADRITVHKGGQVYVSDGGKLTGMVVIEAGAVVSAALNAILDFNISGLSLTDGVTSTIRVNDFSLIQGAPDYILTVDVFQKPGIYRLAGNVTVFNRTITVKNKQSEELGRFKVGGGAKRSSTTRNTI